jgi:hypothetical protein
MPRETIAGRKSFNIVCSPVLLYRVPLVVVLASGPLQENEKCTQKGPVPTPPPARNRPSPYSGSHDLSPVWFVATTGCGFSRLELTLANHAPSSNDLARRRLAGVSLLAGIALGGRCGLLADERFLFHSHCRVSTFYLAVLRNTVEQPDGQIRRGYQTIRKPLQTMRWRIRLDTEPPRSTTQRREAG